MNIHSTLHAGVFGVPSTILPYIQVGAAKRQEFEDVVEEFFDEFEAHMWIKGKAGLGKTHTVKTTAETKDTFYISLPGRQTIWGVMKKLSVALHTIDWPSLNDNPSDDEIDELPQVAIHFDDMTGWDDKDFINWLKIAMDQKEYDKASYDVSLSAQYNQSEDWEKVAIDHFRQERVTGLHIPFWNKVKFIFTMNHALNDENDLTEYKNRHGLKASKSVVRSMEDRAAIFSRVDYIDMELSKEEAWGWLADLTMSGQLCPGATQEQVGEMLTFLWNNWDNLRETSARAVVQKMWRHLKKSRNSSHLNRWQQLVK